MTGNKIRDPQIKLLEATARQKDFEGPSEAEPKSSKTLFAELQSKTTLAMKSVFPFLFHILLDNLRK